LYPHDSLDFTKFQGGSVTKNPPPQDRSHEGRTREGLGPAVNRILLESQDPGSTWVNPNVIKIDFMNLSGQKQFS
jgi:hypothetical protein